MLEQIVAALTSGMWMPAVGAVMIILSWLIAKVRHGVPLSDQLKDAGKKLWAVLPMALLAGGLALVAGMAWPLAAGAALNALLMAAGFSVPVPSKPEPDE